MNRERVEKHRNVHVKPKGFFALVHKQTTRVIPTTTLAGKDDGFGFSILFARE